MLPKLVFTSAGGMLLAGLIALLIAGCGGHDDSSSAPEAGSRQEALARAEEAVAVALSEAPDVYLFTTIYRERTSTYLFVSPDGKTQVAVTGPILASTAKRWDVSTDSFLPVPVLTLPRRLDIPSVRMAPRDVLRLFADKTGLSASDLFVQVAGDPATGRVMWSAGLVSPLKQTPGDRSGPILCQLIDADGTWIEPC